ncbi:MAG: hypothetical protein AB7V46_18425 [Thermomicrobiales bacterium]
MKTMRKTLFAGAMAIGSVVGMGGAQACCDPMVDLAQLWQSLKGALEVKAAPVQVATMPVMNMDLESVQPHQTVLQSLGRKTLNKLVEIGAPPSGFTLKKLGKPTLLKNRHAR